MEVRVGEWHLCEEYIDEPVQIRTVESKRIEVRYLISGKSKWLGFPKIWQACKPHSVPFDLKYDGQARVVKLLMADRRQPANEMTLSQLRAAYLPKSTRPRLPEPVSSAAAETADVGWGDDRWSDAVIEVEPADYELESESED